MVCQGYVNTNFEVQMIPQFMHVNQIAAKDTAIAEKDVTIAKQKDTLAAQELTIKRLTTENDALKAAHELEVDKLKQKDGLTTQELMIRRLNADIEAQKAAYEEEIETLRQRWRRRLISAANARRRVMRSVCILHEKGAAGAGVQ